MREPKDSGHIAESDWRRGSSRSRRRRHGSPTLRRGANPQTISVWIHQVDLTTPRLFHDLYIELHSDGLDLAYLQIDESVRYRIASVLREEDPRLALA